MDYQALLTPLTLKNGVKLRNRLTMAPMCDYSSQDGQVVDEQCSYMADRSNGMGMLVTGFAYVNDQGIQVPNQLSAAHDSNIAGLRKLATAMKSGGAKAILQLSHAGREAAISASQGQPVYAPTKMDFPWLSYSVEEMTENDIQQVIKDFADATHRAIQAGFDGVEIHDGNHDLMQQFFSKFSNHRKDKWGQDRSLFAKEIQQAIKQVISSEADDNFILGWRISPYEIHGENIGFVASEMQEHVKLIAQAGIDYLNVSINPSETSYNGKPDGNSQTYAEMMKDAVGEQIPILIGGNIFKPEQALDALKIADAVYLGREMMIEPHFGVKLQNNQADLIVTEMTRDRLSQVQLPDSLIKTFSDPHGFWSHMKMPGLN